MTARPLRPYQRRRTRPVAILVSVLAVVALATWTTVLITSSGGAGTTSCPAPAAGTAGTVVEASSLESVTPAAAAASKVRVLNGGGQRGQANLVAAQLGDLGFAEAGAPGNDPLYPDGDLDCRGQIRFGEAGAAAAATLAIVVPCTELVRDARGDDSVDLAVGTAFSDVKPSSTARDVLDQLANPSVGDGSGNADESGAGTPPGPAVDPALLQKARDTPC
ncbi:hypothetical protein Psed_3053 [Pseudonocardia dioxanivorans CB1190]|uniref:LytR/CpsA/Psr regulator C-terminal domain-containing protein n=1 Tax=Pseudonocardia dioxanivorans (strain ATCC 55486 / DSM 44775 / JCM 13855 / CB1190) TaxID=675635 RepID=F4CSV3_PSEUX|nr:envelope integrity protein Cei [Pseudonocardia dioxanivorans]AEA25252.1 hypothetical protein Psed_3053 [Pseudonocardia dioxanivorans CB1190]